MWPRHVWEVQLRCVASEEHDLDGRRIVFVEFSPSGGLFQFALQLGTAMAAAGHDVHLVTGRTPELAAQRSGLRVHTVLPTWHPGDRKAPAGGVLRLARRAVRALRLFAAWLIVIPRLVSLHPDVVLWSGWRFGMDAAFVVLSDLVLPRSVLGIVAHEPVPSNVQDTRVGKSGPAFDALLTAAWRRMDVTFVLGERSREVLLRTWRPGGPVIVIPHGDMSALRRSEVVRAVDATDPVVLFFGTWTSYKGIEVLLEAFAVVRRRVPGARLILAGAVSGDVDLRALLRKAEEVGGVDARPGYVSADEVEELLATTRVVVTPYLRASQSGVAHLAHTFGRPVVATDVGDVSSVVRDGLTGLLVPPGRSGELADGIVALLDDPALARRLGDAGRRLLAETSSWHQVAQCVNDGLNQVLPPAGSSASPPRRVDR